jgi:Beta-propeller repeat
MGQPSSRHLCLALTVAALIITFAMTVSVDPSGCSQPVASANESPKLATADASPNRTPQINQERLLRDYGKLPLSFEINQGQTDRRVKFLSRGSGYSLFLTGSEAVLRLHKDDPKSGASAKPRSPLRKTPAVADSIVRVKLVAANADAKVTGLDELPSKSNYFVGNDPKKWSTNVPTYAKVKYASVYPGVDLVYYGKQRQLEYDFVIAPKADARQIQFSFDGASRLRLDAHGNLIVSIAGGEVIEHKPVIYQDIDGMRQQVAGGYEVRNGHTVGFKLADYDHRERLTIDPGLVYSTYLGGRNDLAGSNGDSGTGIAVDSSGNAYITGITGSTDFPTTAGALQTTNGGNDDAFVSKLNSNGSALVYSTYLGGGNQDFGRAVAVDSSGDAYVTGFTGSTDFPTTAGALQTGNGGDDDAFVSKLNSSGSALIYSAYLGGGNQDFGQAIAVDSSGNAYVAGDTNSTDFPTTAGALQTTFAGGRSDAFVSKIATGNVSPTHTFAGTPGAANCHGVSVSALSNQYGTLDAAASALGFPSVQALQNAIRAFCGE